MTKVRVLADDQTVLVVNTLDRSISATIDGKEVAHAGVRGAGGSELAT